MSLIDGKLDGKIIGTKITLQNGQFDFPFQGRFNYTGPWLIFSDIGGITYEVSLTDSLTIIRDAIEKSLVTAILLQDTLYIFDDNITADKIRSLFVTLTDNFSTIFDSADSYKYIGYIFLEHGARFEIKGIS